MGSALCRSILTVLSSLVHTGCAIEPRSVPSEQHYHALAQEPKWPKDTNPSGRPDHKNPPIGFRHLAASYSSRTGGHLSLGLVCLSCENGKSFPLFETRHDNYPAKEDVSEMMKLKKGAAQVPPRHCEAKPKRRRGTKGAASRGSKTCQSVWRRWGSEWQWEGPLVKSKS